MNSLETFSSLVEQLPGWMARLEELATQVASRHAEFSRISRSSMASLASLGRKRTRSTESLRPDEADNIPLTSEHARHSTPPSTPPVAPELQPESKTVFHDFRDHARRKRRSADVTSAAASGPLPAPARTRSGKLSASIVYYDSAIQHSFEALVRCLSSSRNNIRKSRTAESFNARMARMGIPPAPHSAASHGLLRNSSHPSTAKGGAAPPPVAADPFDPVDAQLEAAQSLCEIGAHQFLRDGACAVELAGIRDRFQQALLLAQRQVQLLTAQSAPGLEVAREEKHALEPGLDLASLPPARPRPTDEAAVAAKEAAAVNTKPVFAAPVGPSYAEATLFVDATAIEVDDNDDDDASSLHIDLSAFRRTRRM